MSQFETVLALPLSLFPLPNSIFDPKPDGLLEFLLTIQNAPVIISITVASLNSNALWV